MVDVQPEGQADDDFVRITPIGAGNEVGRSCILVSYKGRKIMLDCGIHPAFSGLSSLPYFDEIDPGSVDLVLISHFHLDHAAAIPYLIQKTNFKGRIFMTHPTRAIYKMMLSDYVRVSNVTAEEGFFNEGDLNASLQKIETIDYHQDLEVKGIKFKCYNAGHVLGACMFMMEVGGVRILYTGDFSRQPDRHLMGAETPPIAPDVLIIESTYGTQIHATREEREERFTQHIHDIAVRGGRCLIPVFALGRAQELLLILDEFWAAHPELQSIPVVYASALARRCMGVYKTYINMMNDNIRSRFDVANPFDFRHVEALRNPEDFDDTGPSVVMASPGMLQNYFSRELFERWCSDRRNGVILPGYCVEGTLAKHIMTSPPSITSMVGTSVPLRCSVHYVSFSAHSDFVQTSEFVEALQPPYVVLVHGEANQMSRLHQALTSKFKERELVVHSPANTETVELRFKAQRTALLCGSLGSSDPADGSIVEGILVRKDFEAKLLPKDELEAHTSLRVTKIMEKQTLDFRLPTLVLWQHISRIYSKSGMAVDDAGNSVYTVYNQVSITHDVAGQQLVFEWEASPMRDMIVDSIIALCMSLESSPEAARNLGQPLLEKQKDVLSVMSKILSQHFEEVRVDVKRKVVRCQADGVGIEVHLSTQRVICPDEGLRLRVMAIAGRVYEAVSPAVCRCGHSHVEVKVEPTTKRARIKPET